MIGEAIGTALISDNPGHTRNLFGPISEIAGKRLTLLERNSRGDCLCLVEGQYLVDVDQEDVVSVEFTQGDLSDPMSAVLSFMTSLIGDPTVEKMPDGTYRHTWKAPD